MADVAMTVPGSEGGELVDEGKEDRKGPPLSSWHNQLILAIQIRNSPNSRKHRFLDCDCSGG